MKIDDVIYGMQNAAIGEFNGIEYYHPRVAIVDQIQAADDLAKLRADLKSFEGLTPGGSEFVNDPKAVYAWIKDRLDTVIHVASERNKLRADLATANQTIAEVMRVIKNVQDELDQFIPEGRILGYDPLVWCSEQLTTLLAAHAEPHP
jgi:hypothetical protein